MFMAPTCRNINTKDCANGNYVYKKNVIGMHKKKSQKRFKKINNNVSHL